MRRPRPVGVWLVLFYHIFMFLLINLALHFGPPSSPASIAYREHLTTLDHVAIQVPVYIWDAALILLFFLRRLAAPLMALSICLSLATEVHLALTTNWLALLKNGIYTVAFFHTVSLIILLYAMRGTQRQIPLIAPKSR